MNTTKFFLFINALIISTAIMAKEFIAPLPLPPQVAPSPKWPAGSTVLVKLQVKHVVKSVIEGVTYSYWTFNESVPGPLIRVKKGDTVKIELINGQDSTIPIAIDTTAANIALGGTMETLTPPGKTRVFQFKASKVGSFIYHGSAPPIGMQVANGLFGMIVVEPKKGLPPQKHEAYLMRSELYTQSKSGEKGHQAFNMREALDGTPDYITFNGEVAESTNSSTTLRVPPKKKLRLFIGNIGPVHPATFRISGAELSSIPVMSNGHSSQQSLFMPPGTSLVVNYSFPSQGSYRLIDQSLFRSFNLGSLVHILVADPNKVATNNYSLHESLQQFEGSAPISIETPSPIPVKKYDHTIQGSIDRGKVVYRQNCMACHQKNGQGIRGVFPPLAKSDFLNKNKKRAISIVRNGYEGKMKVNGIVYNGRMPALGLTKEEIADVLTYIYNNWGNDKKVIRPEEVSSQ